MREQTFFEERDNALYDAYVTALRQPGVKSHQQAIETAINSPTSRFWISPFRAYREILWRKNGYRPHGGISKNRRALVDDLYSEYLRLRDRHMFRGCSTFFIIQFVVGMPAPGGFYMSATTAERIIYRKRCEKIRR